MNTAERAVECRECGYVLEPIEQEHFYAAPLMVCPKCAGRELCEVSR